MEAFGKVVFGAVGAITSIFVVKKLAWLVGGGETEARYNLRQAAEAEAAKLKEKK